ncbi:hypothetical protein [Bacillus inaquosorum]|uniref:hypothetical protein n=1 Tax=Bacillus inaquosorum TaxID=483913 RepID=UPI0022801084|nr:hypothetical protein [Bacillus inaquosorum]MCY9457350.1 hypothetical protein [Bacillus inaquosorum]
MNEKDVIILLHQFRTRADKLLNYYNSDEVTPMRLLRQLINFIDSQPVIKKFIEDNNVHTYDIKGILEENRGNKLNIPVDPQEEVAFVYQLLKYGTENYGDRYIAFVPFRYGFYTGAKYKDKIHEFNNEVVSCLIDRINEYLNEVHIRMTKDPETIRQYVFNDKVNQFNNAERGNIDARQYNNVSDETKELVDLTKDLITMIKEYEIKDTEAKEDALDFLEEVDGALESGKEVKPSLIRRTTQRLKDITSALGASDALALKATKFIETISSIIS